MLSNRSVPRRPTYSVFEVLDPADSSVLKSTPTCGYWPDQVASAPNIYAYVVYFCIHGVRVRVYVVEVYLSYSHASVSRYAISPRYYIRILICYLVAVLNGGSRGPIDDLIVNSARAR